MTTLLLTDCDRQRDRPTRSHKLLDRRYYIKTRAEIHRSKITHNHRPTLVGTLVHYTTLYTLNQTTVIQLATLYIYATSVCQTDTCRYVSSDTCCFRKRLKTYIFSLVRSHCNWHTMYWHGLWFSSFWL